MRRDAVCTEVFNKMLLSPSCLPTDPQYGDSAITEHWVSRRGLPPPSSSFSFLMKNVAITFLHADLRVQITSLNRVIRRLIKKEG